MRRCKKTEKKSDESERKNTCVRERGTERERERGTEGRCKYRKASPSAHLSSCKESQMLKGLEVSSLASSSQESPSDGILDSKITPANHRLHFHFLPAPTGSGRLTFRTSCIVCVDEFAIAAQLKTHMEICKWFAESPVGFLTELQLVVVHMLTNIIPYPITNLIIKYPTYIETYSSDQIQLPQEKEIKSEEVRVLSVPELSNPRRYI